MVICSKGTPSKSQCLSTGYLDKCAQHRDECRVHVENAFKAFRVSKSYKKAKTAKMLRPNKSAIPQDLTTGKEFPYKAPSRTRLGPSSESVASRTKLTGPVIESSAGKAKNAHRNKAWESNGDQVRSCEEYGYEQVYDWGRFTDASAACRGDWRCQLDLAFMRGTPGIADRTLRRKDGRPIVSQLKQRKGRVPKNAMFTLNNATIIRSIVLAGGRTASTGKPNRLAETPARKALIQRLIDGNKQYRFGCKGTCGADEYKSEFAFHKAMYDKHRTVSEAEFEEFERRKAEFNRLLKEWAYAVAEEIEATDPKKARPVKESILPYDPAGDPYRANPIVRFALKNSLGGVRSKTRSKTTPTPTKGKVQKKGRRGEKLERKRKRRGRRRRGAMNQAGPAPTSVFAAPPTKATKIPKTNPGTVDICRTWTVGSKRERDGIGAHSCRLGQFLQREWDRMAAGEISCLDEDQTLCDWSPMEFQRRFVETVEYLETQANYELECNAWVPTITPTTKAGKTAYPTLAALEQTIKDRREGAEEAKAKLRTYEKRSSSGKKVDSYGKSFEEQDSWGDKNWLAAGYKANFDWKVAATERKGNAVCELGGSAGGGFDVESWIRGYNVKLIGGAARGRLNEKGKNEFKLDRSLVVLNQSILPDSGPSGSLVYAPEPIRQSSPRFPVDPKPSFNVDIMGFQLTGSAWGEAEYGVEFRAEGVLNSPSCNLNDVKFGIESKLNPTFAFHGFAQVGVGIGGIASAGVRGMVNIITLGSPLKSSLTTHAQSDAAGTNVNLDFDVAVDIALGTLSGKLMLYVEALFHEETFTLFKWSGLTVSFPLMKPLKVRLPLVGWE
ncbi:MAG: hypothetical protein AAGA54_17410 [Myxococcota bacterium]